MRREKQHCSNAIESLFLWRNTSVLPSRTSTGYGITPIKGYERVNGWGWGGGLSVYAGSVWPGVRGLRINYHAGIVTCPSQLRSFDCTGDTGDTAQSPCLTSASGAFWSRHSLFGLKGKIPGCRSVETLWSFYLHRGATFRSGRVEVYALCRVITQCLMVWLCFFQPQFKVDRLLLPLLLNGIHLKLWNLLTKTKNPFVSGSHGEFS